MPKPEFTGNPEFEEEYSDEGLTAEAETASELWASPASTGLASTLTARQRTAAMKKAVKLRAHVMDREEVLESIASHYGITSQLAHELVDEANSRLLELTGRTRLDHLADSVQFWRAIIQDSSGTYSSAQKMKARERLDKLLGLETASKSQVNILNQGSMGVNFQPSTGGLGDADVGSALGDLLRETNERISESEAGVVEGDSRPHEPGP